MLDKATTRARARPILKRLGIEFGPNELVAALSPGERQMVEIARALTTNARIIVMDESTLTILVWSIATLSLGFVAGIVSLFILRLLVGVFEAPSYIVNNRIVTTWFPERERASTIGIYISAQYVGLGFLTPVLIWIEAAYGWRSVSGILGIIAAVLWATIYRDPH